MIRLSCRAFSAGKQGVSEDFILRDMDPALALQVVADVLLPQFQEQPFTVHVRCDTGQEFINEYGTFSHHRFEVECATHGTTCPPECTWVAP